MNETSNNTVLWIQMAKSSHNNNFTTLEKCGVVLPIHIMNLITKLGYNSIRTIAKLDSGGFKTLKKP